jgi:8-oxo-dGTP pyrophosphatase MutT (NUDIX family)
MLVVRLRDPVSGVELPFPPGGAVELGETPAEAAHRETLEETGLDVPVDARRSFVRVYPFRWAGVDYDVTTHFFSTTIETALPLPVVKDAAYNLGAAWLPIDEALRAMSVHPAIGEAVAEALRVKAR